MSSKKKIPKNPRDMYIFSDEDISINELSKLYAGKKGCSVGQLQKRSANENWLELRKRNRKITVEKTIEKKTELQAESKAKSLSQLNNEHITRVQALIKLSEQLLKQSTKRKKDPETGELRLIIDMNASSLRKLTSNIIDAQAAERLYNNFDPKSPMSETPSGDKNKDATGTLDELLRVLKGEE